MLEKILSKLAVILLEKAVGWLVSAIKRKRVSNREHERIHNAARELQEATTNADIDNAFGRMP